MITEYRLCENAQHHKMLGADNNDIIKHQQLQTSENQN